MKTPIYMDYQATTPTDPRVVEAMLPFFTEHWQNPSSGYLAAKQVRAAIDEDKTYAAAWAGLAQAIGELVTWQYWPEAALAEARQAKRGLHGPRPTPPAEPPHGTVPR